MENLKLFETALLSEEKSLLTRCKYLRDIQTFLCWLNGRELSKSQVLQYKALLQQQYAAASLNSILSSLNHYFKFLGRRDCCLKVVRQQRQIFLDTTKELTRSEYRQLLNAAREDPRLCLLMQTICSTGIRVSEHSFITVEAARLGYAEVRLKGKQRRVYLPRDLCRALLRYAAKRKIASGSIFITSGGKPLDRSNIWAQMKKLCTKAGVDPRKVYPHNLRHLFARTYYSLEKDIVRLADILGHSSINTTRIYTMESGAVHQRQIEKMRLLYIT